MWLRKSNNAKERPSHSGRADALDGLAAVHAFESSASDALLIESDPALTEWATPGLTNADDADAMRRPTSVELAPDANHAIAVASGLSATGLRASVLLAGLGSARDSLAAAAGKHMPLVVHLVCRAPTRQSASMAGDHDDYYAAANTGCFEFFATNAQQALDFAAIARRISERSLCPGICAQDIYETSHSVQNLLVHDKGFVDAYLGDPHDRIEAPTPSQRMLFGDTRRRIPRLIDPDHPAGIGSTQDRESYAKAVAANGAFFALHVDSIIDEALEAFGQLTGRFHGKLSSYRVDDADIVVVAQGSIVDELRVVVDHLREADNVKAGVVGVHVFRPFPGAELTRMLKGKRMVTVLERTDAPLSEDLPLLAQIRASIDKALDNGTARGDAVPYPGYDIYRPGDKPRILSAIHGVGTGNSTFSELVSVYANMSPDRNSRTRYYVASGFNRCSRRFPHHETLQQHLTNTYPELAALSLPPADDVRSQQHTGEAVQLLSLSTHDGLFAANLFAQTLGGEFGFNVMTYPQGGVEPGLQPMGLVLTYVDGTTALRGRPTSVGVVLVSNDQLTEKLPSLCTIDENGTVIVETNRDPASLWSTLSPRVARWFEDNRLRLLAIDVRRIPNETTSANASDQLAMWALLGAWLGTRSQLSIDRFNDHLTRRLTNLSDGDRPSVDEITTAITRGAKEVVAVRQGSLETRNAAEHVNTPWTVKGLPKGDETVFDPARFWRSVGYLYNTGQEYDALTDPYVATGVIPAQSSAFRDLASYRIRVPSWLPENCTGCGLCWTLCPESALPATIQSIAALLRAAMATCEAKGLSMVQMNRVADHLAKQANRIVAKGGPQPTVSASNLLGAAFSELVGRMNLEGDALEAVNSEFQNVRAALGDLAVCRTEEFFDQPNKAEKGSGTLLTVALNPLSCTACGICVDVCPDSALEWTEQSPDRLAALRRTWETHMALPEASPEVITQLITEAPESNVNRLLDKNVYHSMVGGDGALPGDGAKTAIHLVTAAVESVMRPRFRTHVDKLTNLIARIEGRIQKSVAGTVEINDFENFAKSLNKLKHSRVTAGDLAQLVGEEVTSPNVDRDQLAYLNDLLQKIKDQRDQYADGASGGGRARMILSIDAGSGFFWHGTYPFNPHPHPWIRQLVGDGLALAEGVFVGLTQRLAQEFKTCRLAELELDGTFGEGKHELLSQPFDRTHFTDEEWKLVPPVIVVSSQTPTRLQNVSRLLASDYPIKVVALNTEGPLEGAPFEARLALAQDRGMILQASVGHPGHLIGGVIAGINSREPALFHIYAPSTHIGRVASANFSEQAKLAYESRAWPLFERTPGSSGSGLSLGGNPDARATWATTTRQSGESKTETLLTLADWASRDPRYRKHFRFVPEAQVDERAKPLVHYLALDAAGREGVEPFIRATDEAGASLCAIVAPEMIAATEEAARFWSELQKTASFDTATGGERAIHEETTSQVSTPTAAPAAAADRGIDPGLYENVADRLLQLCGYGEDPEFFKQSLRDFVKRESSLDSEN